MPRALIKVKQHRPLFIIHLNFFVFQEKYFSTHALSFHIYKKMQLNSI